MGNKSIKNGRVKSEAKRKVKKRNIEKDETTRLRGD